MKKTGLVLACLLFAAHARAQTDIGMDPAKVRVRIGPLWMNPAVALTNLGVDNNVFNDATDPKSDFTFTVSPRTDLWLRAGRTWLHGNIVEDLVWYQDYESERAGNGSYSANWIVPLNRLTMNAGGSWLNTKQRQGYEIDARAYRHETGYFGSASLRLLAKTSVGVNVGQQHTVFAEDSEFRDVNLREELTRWSTVTGISVSHRVTPLTTISVEVAREQVQFDYAPDRDTNSNLVVAKVAFDPLAAMQGVASFGYREFSPVARDVPGYDGTTAAVDLTYLAFGTTKINGKIARDVQFSYDSTRPYYLQRAYSLEVTQQLYGPVDLAGRAGTALLAYRHRGGAQVSESQPDRTRTLGGGFGYRLGQDIRIGVNVDHQKRTSPTQGHGYDGLRIWTSVGYGL